MEFNKNIDIESALEYVNKQIKEKSQAWVSSFLDKKDREDNSETTVFSEEDEAFYKEITQQLAGKKQPQINKIFSRMTEDEYKTYTKIGEQKQDEKMIEDDALRMIKIENFLRTAAEVKEQLTNNPK